MPGLAGLSKLQDEKHTGENRCLPCTITNSAIAIVGAAALALVSPLAAVGFLFVAVAIIYLKGYLVPRTPTITRKYFPQALLAIFNKSQQPTDQMLDVEQILREEDVAVIDDDKEDIRLVDSIVESIRKRPLKSNPIKEGQIHDLLGPGNYTASVDRLNESAIAVKEGENISQWPSFMAIRNDLRVEPVLSTSLTGWDQYSPRERATFLRAVRSLLETCPVCQRSVTVTEETKESCCSSLTVLSVECEHCQERLVEVPAAGGT